MSFVLSQRHFLLSAITVCLLTCAWTANVFAQEDDKDPVKLYNQGQDAHEKGDFKTALKFYEEAIKIYPEFLHPNLKEITLRPWGAKEFALMDRHLGVRIQEW